MDERDNETITSMLFRLETMYQDLSSFVRDLGTLVRELDAHVSHVIIEHENELAEHRKRIVVLEDYTRCAREDIADLKRAVGI